MSSAVALAVCLGVSLAPAVSADERADEEARVQQIWDDAMVGTVGGTAGFYLKPVGGDVLLSSNETYVHDPASSIKVLAHLHAMREVQAGRDHLASSLTAYRYPSARNGEPSSPTLCVEPADETPANGEQVPLSSGLARMMWASDNRMTRAVVLRFGLDPLNELAAELGMTDTRWDQDLVGCGYRDDKRNAMTSVDAGKLYEAVASGRALDPSHTRRFWELMAEIPVKRGDHLLAMIQEEARELGKPGAAGPVAEGIVRRWKGGSYNICQTVCLVQSIIREIDGLVSIPFRVDGAVQMRQFVFSAFVADATTPCPDNPCAARERLHEAMYLVTDEVLRTVIRSALHSW